MSRLTLPLVLAGILLAGIVLVVSIGLPVGRRVGQRTAAAEEPLRLASDLLDLTPYLVRAGGSPSLVPGNPREVARVAPDAFRAGRAVTDLRVEGGKLVYGVTDTGNLVVWDCDLDASRVTHMEIRGIRMPHGRGPVYVLWAGPDDPPGAWRKATFFVEFDDAFHDRTIPLEDSYDWRGRVTRMGIQFGVSLKHIQGGSGRVDIGGIRYLEMDLGTRRAREGLAASVRRVTIGRESRSVVHAPAPSRLGVHLEIPPGAGLDFGVGVHPSDHNKPGDGVRFRILFEGEGAVGPGLELYRRDLDVKHEPADRVWVDDSVDLGGLAGRTGRLVFETGGGRDARFDDALWAHPTLHGPRRPDGPPNLVVISLDTVRADHLGCYGYERNTSPRLDAFASDAVLFENAFSQAPETVMSHMTLFTSLYPSVHGIRMVQEGRVLSPRIPTLAGVLAGGRDPFVTAAFTEGGGVSSFVGFDRGFQRYHNGDTRTKRPQKMIESTFPMAMDWLRRNADRRFFLFLHTYEAHSPYDPPPPYDRTFCEGYDGPIQPPIGADTVERLLLERRVKYGDPGVERIVGLYDGGIRHLDDWLGRLFDEMGTLGLLDDTWVVVLADHGEDFFDHFSLATHGHSLYDELVHVPLLIRPPGGRAREWGGAPARISLPVGLIDVMPTLLDELGIPAPAGLEGRSLARLLEGGSLEERPIFMEDQTGLVRYGVRYRGVKRIFSPRIEENALVGLIRRYADVIRLDRFEGILDEEQAFDLARDPHERFNLLRGEPPEGDDLLEGELARWMRYLEANRRETGAGGPVSPEELERLRRLGYQAGAGG